MTITFNINDRPIEFRLVDEGDTLCLMADDFYVLSFKPNGLVVTYGDGANKLNGLRGDKSGHLVVVRAGDVGEV